ncbi:MAG: flagellar export protein FliJ [Candidatus Adiutrix sp.]|nr:flagellar export protein FliJ [Candidatus Adiutrix sp.]
MAGFKFKLDFLIKLRQRKEEEAMSRLAKRLASIKELEREIGELTEKKARLVLELEEKIKAGEITIPLLTLYKEYDQKMVKDIAKLNEFLRLSRREEAKERAALTKASIDRKIMEKLKDKKKAEFTAEQMYMEQNTLEEMAALAKARRDRNEANDALSR